MTSSLPIKPSVHYSILCYWQATVAVLFPARPQQAQHWLTSEMESISAVPNSLPLDKTASSSWAAHLSPRSNTFLARSAVKFPISSSHYREYNACIRKELKGKKYLQMGCLGTRYTLYTLSFESWDTALRERKSHTSTVHVSQKAPITSTFFLDTRKQKYFSRVKHHCICLSCFEAEVRCCGCPW